jgi:hypothetical protein
VQKNVCPFIFLIGTNFFFSSAPTFFSISKNTKIIWEQAEEIAEHEKLFPQISFLFPEKNQMASGTIGI